MDAKEIVFTIERSITILYSKFSSPKKKKKKKNLLLQILDHYSILIEQY